ncbi:MAG: flagellar hook-basal body complex protein FliE [Patulibacter sp.]
MTVLPIDSSGFSTVGPEWGIGSVSGDTTTTGSGSFSSVLGQQLEQLVAGQSDATQQSQALATGDASDPSAVVMAVEKAQLQMQLATTLRNKGVEAIQELMRTQV